MKTLAALALAASLVSCAQRSDSTGPGRLSVALTAAPGSSSNASLAAAPKVDAVIVRVVKVRAHAASGWLDVSGVPVEVDLLSLPSSATALGLTHLPAGKVTQVRLLVSETGNRVVSGSAEYPLVVPSGIQSGIKLHGPWTVAPCEETAISLVFDGKRSVWYHPTGQGSPWILRPVIHVKHAKAEGGACEEGPACDPKACRSGLCAEDGSCAPGGGGAPCGAPEECLSGTCAEGGTCAPGGPGEPCRVPGDCASGTCGEDGTCGGSGGGAGSPCLTDDTCLSNACVESVCGPSGEGFGCLVDADCQEGFACVAAVCAPL